MFPSRKTESRQEKRKYIRLKDGLKFTGRADSRNGWFISVSWNWLRLLFCYRLCDEMFWSSYMAWKIHKNILMCSSVYDDCSLWLLSVMLLIFSQSFKAWSHGRWSQSDFEEMEQDQQQSSSNTEESPRICKRHQPERFFWFENLYATKET